MSGNANAKRRSEKSDLVATWSVPLLDGVHVIEFEHGTTSGKRVIRIDGEEILRREWMFKLVGEEVFTLGAQKAKCVLRVDPLPLFAFSYSLLVDGKSLEKFTEKQESTNRYWTVTTEDGNHKVVLADILRAGIQWPSSDVELMNSPLHISRIYDDLKVILDYNDFLVERHSLDVFVDGKTVETENTFVEDGTEMQFEINGNIGVIRASFTHKKEGVIHELYVNGKKVEEDSRDIC